jgi:hypothetical protein
MQRLQVNVAGIARPIAVEVFLVEVWPELTVVLTIRDAISVIIGVAGVSCCIAHALLGRYGQHPQRPVPQGTVADQAEVSPLSKPSEKIEGRR